MLLVAEVFANSSGERLTEAVIVHLVDHPVTIDPVALMLPEEEQALLRGCRSKGQTKIAEDDPQVTHGEDVVTALSCGQEHGAEFGLQL